MIVEQVEIGIFAPCRAYATMSSLYVFYYLVNFSSWIYFEVSSSFGLFKFLERNLIALLKRTTKFLVIFVLY